MPFTYVSHQAPVLALKRRWPAAFDGTAMVFGSMAPDWAYAVDHTWLEFDGHSIGGVLAFCVPVAVLASLVLRRVAPVLFAYVPSPAQLPLRQLRALGWRRRPLATSAMSALVGALTHVGWDLFTHDDRWAPRHINWLRSHAVTLGGRWISWAQVLQYVSHVVGALVAVYLLSRILRSGSFRRWYDLAEDDTAGMPPGAVRFWAITVLGAVAGVVCAPVGHPTFPGVLIRISLGVAVGLVAASAACARRARLPARTNW